MSEAFTFLTLIATVVSGTALLAAPVGQRGTDLQISEPVPFATETRLLGSEQGIFVEADVNGQRLTFLVDTGASMTILSERDAKALGLRGTRSRLIRGIGGTIEARATQVDLDIEGKRIANLDVAIAGHAPHSLLGFDAMKQLGRPQLIFR